MIQFLPLLTSLLPVIGSALVSESKTPVYNRALDVLSAFLNKDIAKMSPQEIELEVAKLNQEERISLKSLDNSFRVEMVRLQKEIGRINAETTLQDAKSEDRFQNGWRPSLAWACVLGLIYGWLITPLISSAMAFSMLAGTDPDLVVKVQAALPALPLESILGMVSYLLGYGGYRTYEKKEGLAGDK